MIRDRLREHPVQAEQLVRPGHDVRVDIPAPGPQLGDRLDLWQAVNRTVQATLCVRHDGQDDERLTVTVCERDIHRPHHPVHGGRDERGRHLGRRLVARPDPFVWQRIAHAQLPTGSRPGDFLAHPQLAAEQLQRRGIGVQRLVVCVDDDHR